MKKLILDKAWPAKTGTLQPGSYDIPAKISMTLARCARADGAGRIVKSAPPREKGRGKTDQGSAPAPTPPSVTAGDNQPPKTADDLQNPGELLV